MTNQKYSEAFQVHRWQRDYGNPILPPGPEWFDVRRCMNPFVVRQQDLYLMFYSGADSSGVQRICLATARVGDIRNWTRNGPILDVGETGSFDEMWCVLPCVHKFGNRWHLYYTGRNSQQEKGLQSFAGIGLAVSEDLYHWQRYSQEPVLRGDGFNQWSGNEGVAGGGSIVEIPQQDGRVLYRMYYTLATGTPNPDLLIDQAKCAVVAHSWDGIEWFDKQVVMMPRLEVRYENAATIALNVWKTATNWRAIYAGIGSQFGAYSICEATSRDGLHWERGLPGENLALPPQGEGWESQMTEYPNIVREEGQLRLFYCGNGYGATGIGTAVAEEL